MMEGWKQGIRRRGWGEEKKEVGRVRKRDIISIVPRPSVSLPVGKFFDGTWCRGCGDETRV